MIYAAVSSIRNHLTKSLDVISQALSGVSANAKCSFSEDREALWLDDNRYDFVGFSASNTDRGELTGNTVPVRLWRKICKSRTENAVVWSLSGIQDLDFIAVTGQSGFADIFRKSN